MNSSITHPHHTLEPTLDFTPRISIEQWRTLIAVVDAGGYAQAAVRLHKSQSSITYAVKKLEQVLGVTVFEIQGRKAVLTTTGQLLYRRATALLEEAGGLERAARKLSAGWEAELTLAVDHLFPSAVLLECLAKFGEESPHTRIEVIESVLNGATEALEQGRADIAIANIVPSGWLGDPLAAVRLIAVASPQHPLHQVMRLLTNSDLRRYRHLVVRDSSSTRRGDALGVEATQRWTFSNIRTSIDAAVRGYGFAWFPEEKIRWELDAGRLAPLKLREGSERNGTLYLIHADRDAAGPGSLRLSEIIRETTARACRAHQAQATPAPQKKIVLAKKPARNSVVARKLAS